LTKTAPRTTLRWVEPQNLHITLWFLGEVADEGAADIRVALEVPFRTAAFPLHIGGAGLFPKSGPPRALWFGIETGGDSLRQIHGELAPRLASLGFAPERREYSAHLTIARFKDVARAEVPAVRGVVGQSTADIGECQAGAVTLFRSRLSPKGAQYESVLRVPLT
jgi:2'-5' RNA ligase